MFKDQTHLRHITGSRAVISKTFTVHERAVFLTVKINFLLIHSQLSSDLLIG